MLKGVAPCSGAKWSPRQCVLAGPGSRSRRGSTSISCLTSSGLGRIGPSWLRQHGKAKTAPAAVLTEEGNGTIREVRKSYVRAEDLAILGFIADNKRYGDVGGVEMWKLMEEREVVVGRSWQSMKERFRKKILTNIKKYNLSKEHLRGFTSGGGKEKQKRMGAKAPISHE